MKARALRESAQDIVGKHGGAVPDTMEALTALRGVGRKTASVVLGYAFGKPAVIVDTHFIRLSRRMGLTVEFDPGKIEADVAALLPEDRVDGLLASHDVARPGDVRRAEARVRPVRRRPDSAPRAHRRAPSPGRSRPRGVLPAGKEKGPRSKRPGPRHA